MLTTFGAGEATGTGRSITRVQPTTARLDKSAAATMVFMELLPP
ncbi:MAG TPA: hypothetical protein VIV54_02645 [Burkholderiales bacterium]